jgi:hypothetical protein
MMSALEALDWMKSKVSACEGHVLFRGQKQVWPSVRPSITRDDEQTRREMWTVCRRFNTAASGITGYSIPREHDRLAILQHYIGRSPIIDLTATPEVALYFALLGAPPGRECVVYSINQSASTSSEVVFSDHAFLTLPLKDGGAKHRWLRQDGYSVGPADWRDPHVVQIFDFLRLPEVDSRCFIRASADDELIHNLGDLEDTSSDPLALAVRGALTAVIRSSNLMTANIETILRASKTRDPQAELAAEIDSVISLASAVDAPKNLIVTLRTLRSTVGVQWDATSFHCTLDGAYKQVQRLQDAKTQVSVWSGKRAQS